MSIGGVKLVFVKDKSVIAEVASMADTIWREHYADVISTEQIDYMLDKFQSPGAIADAISGGYAYYIIVHDGQTLGYVGVKENEPAGKLFLSKIYLLREHRGCGYATEALERLTEQCRQRGLEAIWLTVNKRNSSVEWYKKMGFEVVKPIVTDIGGGFVMDDYMMEKPVL